MIKTLLALFFLVSCTATERVVVGTVYLDVVGNKTEITSKVQSLILDDMGRFECVMPRDWNIKRSSTPCMKVVKYDTEFSSYEKSDLIVRISLLEGKSYSVEHFCFKSGSKKSCKVMGGLKLKSEEEATAVNFAKNVITSPMRMIGSE